MGHGIVLAGGVLRARQGTGQVDLAFSSPWKEPRNDVDGSVIYLVSRQFELQIFRDYMILPWPARVVTGPRSRILSRKVPQDAWRKI